MDLLLAYLRDISTRVALADAVHESGFYLLRHLLDLARDTLLSSLSSTGTSVIGYRGSPQVRVFFVLLQSGLRLGKLFFAHPSCACRGLGSTLLSA